MAVYIWQAGKNMLLRVHETPLTSIPALCLFEGTFLPTLLLLLRNLELEKNAIAVAKIKQHKEDCVLGIVCHFGIKVLGNVSSH